MSIIKLSYALLACGSLDNKISIFNPLIDTLFLDSTLQRPSCNGIHRVIMLNNQSIASGCDSGIIHIWNMTNLSLVETLNGHSTPMKFFRK